MRMALIADLHGNLPPIPPCDVLVVAGDICGGPAHDGKRWRPDLSDSFHFGWFLTQFLPWTRGAPHTIAVAGNHDTCLVGKEGVISATHEYPDFTYLLDSGCEVGGLKFWGTPWTRWFDGLAYNLPDENLRRYFALIPSGTDVLVSHGPPLNARDNGLGSAALREEVLRASPRMVVCGHIHEAVGACMMNGVTVVNASGKFVIVES